MIGFCAIAAASSASPCGRRAATTTLIRSTDAAGGASRRDPKWRPPRLANPRPLDRLRDKLNAIIDDEEHGEHWLKALAERLPGEAIEAFLDHKQMTADELKVIVAFTGEFGQDMRTGKRHRRPPDPPVSTGFAALSRRPRSKAGGLGARCARPVSC